LRPKCRSSRTLGADSNGVANGTTINEKNVTNGWTAQGKFTCSARAAEPAAPKPADPGNPAVDNVSTITDNIDLYQARQAA